MSSIRAVWFDVGEVLINETREYGTWADWLGIPRHTFSATFGAVIARGQDYRDVFHYFDPDFDLDAQRQARLDAGLGEYLNANDLYPDVRPGFITYQPGTADLEIESLNELPDALKGLDAEA